MMRIDGYTPPARARLGDRDPFQMGQLLVCPACVYVVATFTSEGFLPLPEGGVYCPRCGEAVTTVGKVGIVLKTPAEWTEHARARRAVGFAEPLPTAWESWMRWLGLSPTPKHHPWRIRDEDYYRLHNLATNALPS